MSKIIPCRLSRSITRILSEETGWNPFPFGQRMQSLHQFMKQIEEEWKAPTDEERDAIKNGARKALDVLETFIRSVDGESLTVDEARAVARAGNAILTACYICGPSVSGIVEDAVIHLTNRDGMGAAIDNYAKAYEQDITTVSEKWGVHKDYAIWANVWFASIGNAVVATLHGTPVAGFEPDFG